MGSGVSSGLSEMNDLEQAVGQYIVYSDVLHRVDPEREIFLAVTTTVFTDLFEESIGKLLIDDQCVRLIVFNEITEVILQWIPV